VLVCWQAACDLIDLDRDRTAVAHSVVSSIQERCRLAESLDDLKVMGEAKQGMELGPR